MNQRPRRVEKPWGRELSRAETDLMIEAATPRLDDVVRCTDRYGRALSGAG